MKTQWSYSGNLKDFDKFESPEYVEMFKKWDEELRIEYSLFLLYINEIIDYDQYNQEINKLK